jgi:hypothetical protein
LLGDIMAVVLQNRDQHLLGLDVLLMPTNVVLQLDQAINTFQINFRPSVNNKPWNTLNNAC